MLKKTLTALAVLAGLATVAPTKADVLVVGSRIEPFSLVNRVPFPLNGVERQLKFKTTKANDWVLVSFMAICGTTGDLSLDIRVDGRIGRPDVTWERICAGSFGQPVKFTRETLHRAFQVPVAGTHTVTVTPDLSVAPDVPAGSYNIGDFFFQLSPTLITVTN